MHLKINLRKFGRVVVVAQLVDRVASNTRDPQFDSRHRQNLSNNCTIVKDKNKEKEAGNGPSLKKEMLSVN